jgi:7,8-dihydropterin-6-yl-methyl-4-(beta-D-ribofuranosyl)aminobenzene 5'-phosphate synthase
MKQDRRSFLKSLGAAGIAASVAGPMSGMLVKKAEAGEKVDFGEIKSVKVDVLTETSWFDNTTLKNELVAGGGAAVSQYKTPWSWENAGGYSALVTVTTLEGDERKLLLDSGWNTEWMDYIFEEKNNIPSMLKSGEIEALIISHCHLDHYWGIESTLKHKPDIPMYIPETWYPEDKALLKDKANFAPENKAGKPVHICKNDYPHTGKLVLTETKGEKGDGIYRLMPGVALRMFDVPILLRVRGENVLYFKVKDKGVVTVTGCCHPGLLTLNAWARRNVKGYQPYGCYGGLHISVFENWDPKFDDIIKGVKAFKLKKVGCNHCTGWIWAERAREAGIPIVRGTDKFRSYTKISTVAKGTNVFLTNGDSISF